MSVLILTNKNVGRECEAPAELFRATDIASIACGRWAAAHEGSAGVSPSRDPLAIIGKDV
jgi:hypothetical protein